MESIFCKEALKSNEYRRVLQKGTKRKIMLRNVSLNSGTSVNREQIESVVECQEVHPTAEKTPRICDDLFTNDDEDETVLPRDDSVAVGNEHITKDISRRIVDIGYIIEESIKLGKQHANVCKEGTLFIKKEVRNGFLSKYTLECTICHREFKISTERNEFEKNELNRLMVWGTVSTGSTFSHLQELMAVAEIPCMSRGSFFKIQDNLSDLWQQEAIKNMNHAAMEERKIAIQNGQIDDSGIPFITVYLDGGWSKRSYSHNYNAASGTAVIIGKETKKILYLGVRNKFCIICARSPLKNHLCFRNWSGSSPAMEADVIVQGFNESIAMYGLKYKKFIADGDSSVYAKIQKQVSYGCEVQKIECMNHIIKNYGKRLHGLRNDKGLLLPARKILTIEIIKTLQRIAQKAIYDNGHGDVQNLISDLKVGPKHVLGNHMDCKHYFCENVGQISTNYEKVLESGVLKHIQGVLNPVIRRANLLLDPETTNRAETFMAILNRFNAGKRLNLIQRRSYQTRAYLAALRYNEGKAWHKKPIRRIIDRPGVVLTKIMDSTYKKERTRKVKKYTLTHVKNVDYGKSAEQPEMTPEEVDSECERMLQTFEDITSAELKKVEECTRGQFSNFIYRKERQHRLTSSYFGKICKMREYTSCHNIVKTILWPNFKGNVATNYGNCKEEVVRQLLETKLKKTIRNCGLYIHPIHKFLAASPDGFIEEDNTIVEIKCPYFFQKYDKSLVEAAREVPNFCLKVEGDLLTLKHNHDYFYQVQGQLHVTGAQKCIFVVYSGDAKPLHIQEIYPNPEVWGSMLEKLCRFYLNCMLPEIVRGNISKGKICVDPKYIKDAQENRKQIGKK